MKPYSVEVHHMIGFRHGDCDNWLEVVIDMCKHEWDVNHAIRSNYGFIVYSDLSMERQKFNQYIEEED